MKRTIRTDDSEQEIDCGDFKCLTCPMQIYAVGPSTTVCKLYGKIYENRRSNSCIADEHRYLDAAEK